MKRAIALLLALVATGCAANTPVPPARSAAELAGVVAKHQPDLEDAEDQISVQGCQRRGGTLFSCLTASARITRLRTFVTKTEEFVSEFHLGADPAKPVAGIYEATINAGSEVLRLNADAIGCWRANAGKTIDPCEQVMQELTDGAAALIRELRAWQPYL